MLQSSKRIDFKIITANPEKQEGIEQIITDFDQQGSVFKNFYKRNTLKTIALYDETVMVKSFKVPGLFKRYIYGSFRKSKARRSYENSVKLAQLGIRVPAPIAYAERKVQGQLYESFYFSKFENRTFTVHDVLLKKVEIDQVKLLQAFTAYTYQLHQKGILHLDLTPGNILVSTTESGFEFSLVDVNRMEFQNRAIPPSRAIENLGRLTELPDAVKVILDTYSEVSKTPRQILQQRFESSVRCYQGYRKLKAKVKGFFKNKKLHTVTSLN